MELVELTSFLVKSITKRPDKVLVKQFIDENKMLIIVIVAPEDIALVIGRHGANINAIKTIVYATKRVKNIDKSIEINVETV